MSNSGIVKSQDVEAAINPRKTVLISVMHSNNEVGAIQPIKEIAIIANSHGISLHCDAAQSVGKVGIHVIGVLMNIFALVFWTQLLSVISHTSFIG